MYIIEGWLKDLFQTKTKLKSKKVLVHTQEKEKLLQENQLLELLLFKGRLVLLLSNQNGPNFTFFLKGIDVDNSDVVLAEEGFSSSIPLVPDNYSPKEIKLVNIFKDLKLNAERGEKPMGLASVSYLYKRDLLFGGGSANEKYDKYWKIKVQDRIKLLSKPIIEIKSIKRNILSVNSRVQGWVEIVGLNSYSLPEINRNNLKVEEKHVIEPDRTIS